MKVIYDISLLGIGHHDPGNRTGIFRVVENLAYELAKSSECDLSFSVALAPSYLPALKFCSDYLAVNPTLAHVPFSYSKFRLALEGQITSLSEKNDQAQALQQLLLKVVKKLFIYAKDSTEFSVDAVSHKSLANADIFHSPCNGFTKKITPSKKLKRFMTVHDLISILHPEFCQGTRNLEFTESVVNSIRPDDWVISVSEATKNDLCNYRKDIDPARVFVAPLAAASDVFYPCTDAQEITSVREKYGIPDAPYILSLCTLEPRKNIDHVIRCFAQLVQEQNLKDLYLVLVGNKGWSYDKIFEELANFNLAKERVIITSFVVDRDLAALYSGALAFAYLSFYEGFGLPPLEAMQCGIPVITSNTSSLPEVVGDAAITLDPLDKDGLCQSLLNLYHDSALRADLSRKSLQQAKQFSWGNCTQDTLAAYRTALSNSD